jgi:UDP-galactopyranose mutase
MEEFLSNRKVQLDGIRNSRDAVVSGLGIDLYEKFYKNYTFKQWGIPADRLSPSVCSRIPIRFDRDDRYFDDPYQGMPLLGYTRLFERMLSHESIDLQTGINYKDIPAGVVHENIVYTGTIDEYFDYYYGRLAYRSLRFDFQNSPVESFQDYAVINYPNNFDYTRITEYKKLTGQKAAATTVSYEYPSAVGEPYYPIPEPENHRLYEKYHDKAKKLKKVFFAGRLGTYRYLNMDIACLEGIRKAKELLK